MSVGGFFLRFAGGYFTYVIKNAEMEVLNSVEVI